jgi:hypothetical protein
MGESEGEGVMYTYAWAPRRINVDTEVEYLSLFYRAVHAAGGGCEEAIHSCRLTARGWPDALRVAARHFAYRVWGP